jgi:hypothetical protein
VAQPGRSQSLPAMLLKKRPNGAGQPARRNWPEDVGEEVEADVVEIGDETLAAGAGEIGKEARAWATRAVSCSS